MRSIEDIKRINGTTPDHEPRVIKICAICDEHFMVDLQGDWSDTTCYTCQLAYGEEAL